MCTFNSVCQHVDVTFTVFQHLLCLLGSIWEQFTQSTWGKPVTTEYYKTLTTQPNSWLRINTITSQKGSCVWAKQSRSQSFFVVRLLEIVFFPTSNITVLNTDLNFNINFTHSLWFNHYEWKGQSFMPIYKLVTTGLFYNVSNVCIFLG